MKKYLLDLAEDSLDQIRDIEGADVRIGSRTEMVFVLGFKQYMDLLETVKRLRDELKKGQE